MRTVYTFRLLTNLLFFLFCFANQLQGKSVWKADYYSKYSCNNYTHFTPFNDTIQSDRYDYQLLNAAIFFETNKQRVKHGLNAYAYHALLEKSAQGHSDDMVNFNFYSHISKVTGKYQLEDRIKRTGLHTLAIGENIADYFLLKIKGDAYYPPSQVGCFLDIDGDTISFYTYQSAAEELVGGWMNSPGHRANILNTFFTHLGVGNEIYFMGTGIDRIPRFKSTQNFARLSKLDHITQKNTTSGKPQIVPKERPTITTGYAANGQTHYSPRIEFERMTIGGSYGVCYESLEKLKNGEMDKQASLILGGYWGKRGNGQNIYGLFPAIEFTPNYPITIECGIIYHRFIHLSAGIRSSTYRFNNELSPSATIGCHIHLGILFTSFCLNGYTENKQLYGLYLLSIGCSL